MYKNNYKERLAKKKKYEKLASVDAYMYDISDIVDTVEANKVKIKICEKVIKWLNCDYRKRRDLFHKKQERLIVSYDKLCDSVTANIKSDWTMAVSEHVLSRSATAYEIWLRIFAYHGYYHAAVQMRRKCGKIQKACHQNAVSPETKSLKRPLTRYEKACIESYMLSVIYDIFRDMDKTYLTLSDEEYEKCRGPKFSEDCWTIWKRCDLDSYFCYDALKAITRTANFQLRWLANAGASVAFANALDRIGNGLVELNAIIDEKG